MWYMDFCEKWPFGAVEQRRNGKIFCRPIAMGCWEFDKIDGICFHQTGCGTVTGCRLLSKSDTLDVPALRDIGKRDRQRYQHPKKICRIRKRRQQTH